jgi:hypothetical protein
MRHEADQKTQSHQLLIVGSLASFEAMGREIKDRLDVLLRRGDK